ncbi:secreted RxLR effector protein 161-like [Cicer arietinum]|uniref:secreted RxLR effector protein 161-like n=1 Tax=Cicer arietinum TaxID=3827 RepID=UPI003CC503CD
MAAKRILRYINETIELGLLYPTNSNGDEAELVGFTNADWCRDKNDRKSTTALSTCEAEYVDASMAICQAICLDELITELGLKN